MTDGKRVGAVDGREGPRVVLSVARTAAADRTVPSSHVSWCPPVSPRALLCVGASCHDYVAEMDAALGLHKSPFPPPPR